MTQFLRARGSSATKLPIQFAIGNIGLVVERVDDPWVWLVASGVHSVGPLLDDLHQRIHEGRPESSPLVALLQTAGECGWTVEFWYSTDSEDLPTFVDAQQSIVELITQASFQPPEVYLRLSAG